MISKELIKGSKVNTLSAKMMKHLFGETLSDLDQHKINAAAASLMYLLVANWHKYPYTREQFLDRVRETISRMYDSIKITSDGMKNE